MALSIEQQFKSIADDIMAIANHDVKKREVVKILKRQAKPVVRELSRAAPTANKTVTYWRNKSIKYDIGNLQRSMKTFTGKNKDFPTVYVGPQAKKSRGSGYYSYYVQYGTKGRSGIKKKNNYVLRTEMKVRNRVTDSTAPELERYLIRKFKKRGFKVA